MKQKMSRVFLNFLRALAKIQLAKVGFLQRLQGKKLTIIGITGSAGKSSCLLALEAILSPHFRVKTNALANSESGIPLNILGLKPRNYSFSEWLRLLLLSPLHLLIDWKSYDLYLVEMGIDEPDPPKNMAYLLTILRPHIGIFLNVGQVHSLQFDKTVPRHLTGHPRQDQIMLHIGQEKAKMINTLPAKGLAIINDQDPIVTAVSHPRCPVVSPQILATDVGPHGFSATYLIDHQKITLNLPHTALPAVYAITFGTAILAAVHLGLTPEAAIRALAAHFQTPPGRSTLLSGIKGTTLIDSSYNSSPLAATEMLALLKAFPPPRLAILGDMRELGRLSPSAHRQLFQTAKNSSDYIIGVGPECSKYFKPDQHCRTFTYWWEALAHLKKIIKGGETVLIKGSQNTIYTEEIVKALLRNPAETQLLCRQSLYWLGVKEKFRHHHASKL